MPRLRDLAGLDALPVCIGVSVPGTVDRHNGTVGFAPNLRWRDAAFGEMLATLASPHVPVVVGNDADLAVLAEHSRGIARGTDDVVFLLGRTGVGAGIIVNGRPLRGHDGHAGEIGHNVIDASGPKCHCGKRGCLETYVGDTALLGLAGRRRRRENDALPVFLAAREGNELAVEAVRTVAAALGRAIAGLVNMLNPELVLLGGSFGEVLDVAGDEVQAALYSYVLDAPGETVRAAPRRPRHRLGADRGGRDGLRPVARRSARRPIPRGALSGVPAAQPPIVRWGAAEFSVQPDLPLSFGRSPECTICIDEQDLAISRIAGRIEVDAGQCWLINTSTSRALAVVDGFGLRSVLPPGRRAVLDGPSRILVEGTAKTHQLAVVLPRRAEPAVGADRAGATDVHRRERRDQRRRPGRARRAVRRLPRGRTALRPQPEVVRGRSGSAGLAAHHAGEARRVPAHPAVHGRRPQPDRLERAEQPGRVRAHHRADHPGRSGHAQPLSGAVPIACRSNWVRYSSA